MEMKLIQILNSRDRPPENYTGIVDYWYQPKDESHGFLKFHYTRVFLINGKRFRVRERNGNVIFYNQKGLHTTFEEMFDDLSPDEKDVIIWNLDIWK